MKDFAMKIWEMPADDFMFYGVIVALVVIMVRQLLVEINTNRVKRFTR